MRHQYSRLTKEEIAHCCKIFDKQDLTKKGEIGFYEFRNAFLDLGQTVSDAELCHVLGWNPATLEETVKKAKLKQSDMLAVADYIKRRYYAEDEDSDTVEAFIAMGGNFDRSGHVSIQKLKNVVSDFNLTINIDKLIDEHDIDHSGFVDFDEFAAMLAKK